MNKGKVKWFNSVKGFGFITPESGDQEVFVHYSEIKCDGYATLQEGQSVDYEIGESEKGPFAKNVVPIQ